MRYLRISLALLMVTALMALSTASVAAHNAGCVQTGNGEWVFVGSNKSSPEVPERNPMSGDDDPSRPGENVLDLQPDDPSTPAVESQGDQYGARYAADQGGSAVERPAPTRCQPGDTPAS